MSNRYPLFHGPSFELCVLCNAEMIKVYIKANDSIHKHLPKYASIIVLHMHRRQ